MAKLVGASFFEKSFSKNVFSTKNIFLHLNSLLRIKFIEEHGQVFF